MSVATVVAGDTSIETLVAPAAELRIQLLGRFQVSVDGSVVDPAVWRLRKAAHLVQLLALAPEHRLHREQVVVHLWPDFSAQSAGNNLRVTLHAARHALESNQVVPNRFLQYANHYLCLSPHGKILVDVINLEEAAKTAFVTRDVDAYERALSLYSGDLVVDGVSDQWIVERRETVRETYFALLLNLAELWLDRAELDLAVEAFKLILIGDLANEEAHVGLMRAYALSGHRLQALRQYQRLQKVLQSELDIEPSQEAQLLYKAIASGHIHAV